MVMLQMCISSVLMSMLQHLLLAWAAPKTQQSYQVSIHLQHLLILQHEHLLVLHHELHDTALG